MPKNLNQKKFVKLNKNIQRHIGIGNSTGLGMAPFLVKHPILLNNWFMVKETALTKVLNVEFLTSYKREFALKLITRALNHLKEWKTEDERQANRISILIKEWKLINDTIKNNADVAKRFMKATIESYAKAEKNPDAAVDAIADIVGGSMAEDAGKAQSREVLDVTLGILYSGANKDKVLGLNVPSDWESMVKLMKEYNDLDKSAKASDFYTNQFIN